MNNKELSAKAAGSLSLGGQVSVHRLGYGAMRLTGEGIWGPPKDRKGALEVLRRAVELGVNFVDTADSYGPSVSEELIAEALFPYPKGFVVATKGGWNRPGPNQWTHDATPKHLREAIEGARKIAQIVSVQNRYSVFDREWDHVVDYCEQNRIAFIPWFPLGAGGVGHEVLSRIAQAHRVKPIQVAIAWLLQRSPYMLPIPGTSSVEHLEENIAAAALRLSEEEFRQLDEVNGKTTAGRVRA